MIWQIKKLGDVCNVVGGGTPKTGILKYWDGDLCWVTPKDLGQLDHFEISETSRKITKEGLKNSSAQELPTGSVILSSRAPIGYVAINTVPMATNQGCRSFICGPEIFNKYLYYFLILNTELLNSLGSGSTFLEVSGSRLKEIEIPLPPLATQQKIVARLDELLSNIAEVKRLRQEAIADTEKILSQTLREIFEEGKEKGWEEKILDSLCLKTENIKWSENKESDFDYIDLSSVSREDFSILETQKVNESNAPSRAKKLVQTNDVIFGTTRPTLMRVTIIPEQYNNQLCSTGFCVLKADITKILPSFIFYFIQSSLFMDRMEKIQTGASYPAVSDSKVLETIIPLPPLPEQYQIVTRLDALSTKLRELRHLQVEQLEDLKKLEKAYLREAFRGELV